ncbi:hypothetical protein [Paraburkholderia domus]|uniref:hypothetical protein n=1 Tax=Paraburkholderia domus TaxID=2793075 RepID=UPI001B1C3927|nr:hypothetical protein [Paraburkholderia domus]CAE6821881.1 hypothetical protein R75483_06286 [Paraburkholderia domus]
MMTGERTLRLLVDKWLGPRSELRTRITRLSRFRQAQRRYVCVEAVRSSGALAIVFFRHDDGSWCVFPPMSRRPEMGYVTRASLQGSRDPFPEKPSLNVPERHLPY